MTWKPFTQEDEDFLVANLQNLGVRYTKAKNIIMDFFQVDDDYARNITRDIMDAWSLATRTGKDVHYAIHMVLWNNFSGGGATSICADRIIEAWEAK